MTLRIGTLGAARITPRALIYPCMDEPRAAVSAVAARSRGRAEAFAAHHGIATVLDHYQEVIECSDVDAVYIPLPISEHHRWALAAIAAGKHVLCEKSLACNAAEAEDMAQAARASGVVLMDAFHYRYHPVFHRAREIYRSGELGEIQRIHAVFHAPVRNPDDIRMTYATGGGVTMDIGCYPISWVRHVSGLEPEGVEARAVTGPPNVDVRLNATLTLPGAIEATVSGDMSSDTAFAAYLTVGGSAGSLELTNPLVPQMGHRLRLTLGSETAVESFDRRPSYGYQLDAFLDAVEHGAPLLTGADDAVAQMRVIDRCYRAAGLPLRGKSDPQPENRR